MLNKKLIALMAVLLFGACSDADLSQNAQGSATEESESSKSSEVKSSSSKKVAKSSSSKRSSSSSSKKKSSSSTKSSSSSAKSKSSSSSKSKSSSSKEPEPTANSSSSAAISASSAASILDFGTCAPARTPVFVGDTISWVMKPNDPSLLLSAVSVWTMPGGSPDYGSGKNALGRAQQTKYTVSGDYTANVVVNVDGEIYQVDCSPLHVNGAPITGCKCTTAETTVDYTATPGVTWSVDGCKTSAGDALAYVWDDVPGEATYTKNFDTAIPGYTPKLKVYSSDNSQLDVTCPTVRVTEGPEYLLTVKGGLVPQDKIEVANGGCISVTGTWENEYYKPTLTVVCDADGNNVEFIITHGEGRANTVMSNGAVGVYNLTLPLVQLNPGQVDISNVCISLRGAESATCGLGTK